MAIKAFARIAAAILLLNGAALPALAQVATPTYKGADRDQKILAGAKKEGKVVFYSGMIVNQALRPLADAFKKKYPFVDLQYWRGDSRAILQKVLSEKRSRRVIGDVFESTGAAEPSIRAGAAQPYYSPASTAYPKIYVDPRGYWVASRLDYFAIGYNTRTVKAADVPKTYQDLLAPKWKNAMAWRSENETGAGIMIATIMKMMGKEKGEQYLKALSAQKIVNYSGSARALVDRVGEGEYKLALGIYAHHPLISKVQGAPLDTYMLQPVPSLLSTIMLSKDAAHPNAALLLIDFILSPEGQKILSTAHYLSANPAIAPEPALKPIVPRLSGLKEMVFTPLMQYEERAEANAMFDKYFR